MLVPRLWRLSSVWPLATICLIIAMRLTSVTADDDPIGTPLFKPRTPGARSPQALSPDARQTDARQTDARRGSDADRATSAGDDVALPTIVTPGIGRRPAQLEDASSPRTPITRLRAANPDVQFDPATPWRLESLVRRDDTVYQGLLLSATHDEVEFAHIVRQPGEPMSAMVRVIPRSDVKSFESLPPDQYDVLAARFHALRQRATIEARKMESIVLHPLDPAGDTRLVYEGQWFHLESSADDESTRRCAVRIEQMFGGFRQLLPPRVEPRGQLRIVLFGSMDEFRGQLRQWKLGIENPAFFSPGKNMIVAGGDLSRFGDQLAQTRRDHDGLLQQFDALEQEFQQQLASVRRELFSAGFQREEIKAEMALRRTRWRDQHSRLQRDVQAANRRNDALFAEVTNRMLKRLYHEAFHAYLENFVFPHRDFHVDRWLNEGLAQIFENAQFDLDVLRLDAPDPVLLAKLQHNLDSSAPLRLADLLAAPESAFLLRHAPDSTDRRYLYAWGVAYFLAFEQNLLDGKALGDYVIPRVSSDSTPLATDKPVRRFERLVDEKLDDFELRWREFIRNLPTTS